MLRKGGSGSVFTDQTYDCPEAELQPVAQIEPAAPPAPVEALPASGVIYFELDHADLDSEGAAGLAAIIDEIKGRDLGGITIAGHTDTSGSSDYNMQLSERRANTVATELIRAGVPATIISADRLRPDRSRGADRRRRGAGRQPPRGDRLRPLTGALTSRAGAAR